MRLIDADALYDTFERTPWMDNADRDIAEEVAENAPTVAEDNNVPVKQPDPITGLVPCGCGGKAVIHEYNSSCCVIYCDKCKIETNYQSTADKAKDAWNRAMGYKEDA